ncbi:TAP-like protein-domain-containing protein [Chaetomium strumarium]|uniref:TAP-like protein-domain-containing protein n=1 Tax=Chaetomium strumarium TaxID=1170767 RepID=A0AAJ0GQP9_9PEZI|nr:TAP-like protein-domain-containing protein [Chaetomium strumarium]
MDVHPSHTRESGHRDIRNRGLKNTIKECHTRRRSSWMNYEGPHPLAYKLHPHLLPTLDPPEKMAPLILALVQAFLLTSAAAHQPKIPRPDSRHHSRGQSSIAWHACDIQGATVPVDCGSLSVPLDYTNAASNTAIDLELARIPAANTPSKGSILFNFGGPGDPGIDSLVALGDVLRVLTGGDHDLVVFVPRGTDNNTLPFSCYNNAAERTMAQLALAAGNSSDVAAGRNWGNAQILAESCYAARNETGALVGTSFVARDMMRIVDALGEDGLLRYWGLSYGTLLGATAAAMFPDRMDKVILDGVVNPHEYYHNREVEMFTDTDAVFAGFCAGCVADPARCPLGRNHSAASLEAAVLSFMYDLKYNPIVVHVPGGPGELGGGYYLLEYTLIRQLTLNMLYAPALWPAFATFLDGLLSRNMDPVVAYLTNLLAQPSPIAAEALPGIKCGDVLTRTSSSSSGLEGILPVVEGRHRASKVAGDAADHLPMWCAQWRIDAKERYRGDFRVKTRKPVLVIGNTYDPVTPLVAARNVSATLEGSVLLQHDGYGHSSLAQASLCTALATRAYFVNGTLPEPGTICDVHVPLFAGTSGFDEILEYFEGGGNVTAKRNSMEKTALAKRVFAPKPPKPFLLTI